MWCLASAMPVREPSRRGTARPGEHSCVIDAEHPSLERVERRSQPPERRVQTQRPTSRIASHHR